MPDGKCQVKNRDSGILPYGGATKGSGEAALAGEKAAQRGVDRKMGTAKGRAFAADVSSTQR
jgi:hypothetical protein